ncbi:MAG: hypothetical protein JXR64_04770, partial [Spirochaetales bacterium]|nr:hypothetical protein [Spirochaetales bacterium]
TYNDPDGNGIDDTKGYTDINSCSEDWYNRAIMLDARVEVYFKDGVWIDGFTEPQMVLALERLKKIYNDGLTDTNLTNNTTFTARNRFINGNVGVFTYWANQWARNLFERTVAISGSDVNVVSIPPLNGGYYIKRIAPLLVITSNSKNPEFVFTNFIDKQYDKGEIQQLFTYGVKGYHWDVIDGRFQFLINNNDPYIAQFTKAFVPPISVLNDWKQPMVIDPIIKPALDILSRYSVGEKLKIGGNYYNQYYLEIDKNLKPKIISSIINNEISIEDGISYYRKKSKELYIEEILKELNY